MKEFAQGSATMSTQMNGAGLRINAASADKMQRALLNTYESPVRPIIELAANGLDEGENVDIKVASTGNGLLCESANAAFVTITDNGGGMSTALIREIFTELFASTKDKDDEKVGGFGIGSKSVMSITDICTWNTVHDGVRTVYTLTDNGTTYEDNISVSDTDDQNGTVVSFTVDGETWTRIARDVSDDFLQWQDPSRVSFTVDGAEWTVGENYVDMSIGDIRFINGENYYGRGRTIHVVTQNNIVYNYDLNFMEERSSEIIGFPSYVIRLNVSLNDVTLNRESLIQTPEMERRLKTAINKAVGDILDNINEEAVKADTPDKFLAHLNKYGHFIEAYYGLNSSVTWFDQSREYIVLASDYSTYGHLSRVFGTNAFNGKFLSAFMSHCSLTKPARGYFGYGRSAEFNNDGRQYEKTNIAGVMEDNSSSRLPNVLPDFLSNTYDYVTFWGAMGKTIITHKDARTLAKNIGIELLGGTAKIFTPGMSVRNQPINVIIDGTITELSRPRDVKAFVGDRRVSMSESRKHDAVELSEVIGDGYAFIDGMAAPRRMRDMVNTSFKCLGKNSALAIFARDNGLDSSSWIFNIGNNFDYYAKLTDDDEKIAAIRKVHKKVNELGSSYDSGLSSDVMRNFNENIDYFVFTVTMDRFSTSISPTKFAEKYRELLPIIGK